MQTTDHPRSPVTETDPSRYPSMKIKRFVAADMRSAMNLVRREHGPEAVILSNRRIEEGVEIVAAAHYDETVVKRALDEARRDAAPPAPLPRPRSAADAMIAAVTRRRAPEADSGPAGATTSAVAALARAAVGATGRTLDSSDEIVPRRGSDGFAATLARAAAALPAAAVNEPSPPLRATPPMPVAPPPRSSADADAIHAAAPPTAAADADTDADSDTDTDTAAAAPRPAAPVLTVVARDDAEIRHLRSEVAGMRQVIEREMQRFADERLRGSPVRAAALDLMDEYGFDAGIARDIALQIPLETEAHRGRGLMLGLLARRLPIAALDPLDAGGVIALVGPTGAGKTTTIAKLASRFAEAHAPRDVALVTTDTARIGAREQLYGFGRQLGIAVHEASSGTDLDRLLERLKDYRLVLIDTAGVGPRDRTLAAQLQWLRAARQVRTQLVLPANTGFADMDEVVRRFGPANLQGLVLSKLDETGRFGTALSVAVDHGLPITWVTDGQDVPEDLHRASAATLVLRLEDLRRAADMPCNPELNHAVA